MAGLTPRNGKQLSDNFHTSETLSKNAEKPSAYHSLYFDGQIENLLISLAYITTFMVMMGLNLYYSTTTTSDKLAVVEEIPMLKLTASSLKHSQKKFSTSDVTLFKTDFTDISTTIKEEEKPMLIQDTKYKHKNNLSSSVTISSQKSNAGYFKTKVIKETIRKPINRTYASDVSFAPPVQVKPNKTKQYIYDTKIINKKNNTSITKRKEIKKQTIVYDDISANKLVQNLNDYTVNTEKKKQTVDDISVKIIEEREVIKRKQLIVEENKTEKELIAEEEIKDLKSTASASHLQFIQEKALTENKLYFLRFGATWCMPCKVMKETTFKDPIVKNYLNKSYIAVDIDVDDFDGYNLKQQYDIKKMPAFVFFDVNGNVVEKHEGTLHTSRLLSILKKNDTPENRIVQQKEQAAIVATKTMIEQLIDAPVDYVKIKMLKKEKGNSIAKIKGEGKNWNYTNIKIKIDTQEQLDLASIDKFTIKITDTDTGLTMSMADAKIVSINENGILLDAHIEHINNQHKRSDNYSFTLYVHEKEKQYLLKKGNQLFIQNRKKLLL